jgi:hypothetical protein
MSTAFFIFQLQIKISVVSKWTLENCIKLKYKAIAL